MSRNERRDMRDDKTPDLDQNPYHPFEETERHRAFQEGWEARHEGKSRADCPYNLSQADVALAWLDGWTAAQNQESGDEADSWRPETTRRSETDAEVSVS